MVPNAFCKHLQRNAPETKASKHTARTHVSDQSCFAMQAASPLLFLGRSSTSTGFWNATRHCRESRGKMAKNPHMIFQAIGPKKGNAGNPPHRAISPLSCGCWEVLYPPAVGLHSGGAPEVIVVPWMGVQTFPGQPPGSHLDGKKLRLTASPCPF